MTVHFQNVCDLFTRYGWIYETQEDKQTLLTGFRGQNAHFKIVVFLKEGWLSLSVLDYLPQIPTEKRDQVYQYILEMNSKITFVRIALVDDGRVSFVVDLPAESRLDYNLFAMALDLLSYYADTAYPKLYEQITGEIPPTAIWQETTA